MSDGRRPGGEPAMSGPEHDAWLREALRHAPDAGAAPPSTLRDAILAEARAAARAGSTRRAAAAPSLIERALEFWSWLARPQVAAGFASVMAATLVGMLWWDRPMDETMLPPPVASPPAMAPPAARPDATPAARPEAPPAATTAPAAKATRKEKAPADSDLQHEAPPPAVEPGPRDATSAAGMVAAPRSAEEAAALDTARRQQEKRQAARDDTEARARAATEAKPTARSEAAKNAGKDDRKAEAAPQPAPAPATRSVAEAPAPFPARPPVEADAAPRPAQQQAARPASPPPATPSPSFSTAPSIAAAPPPPAAATPPRAPAMTQPAPAAPGNDLYAVPKAESGEKESSLAKSRAAAPLTRQAPAGALGGAAVDSAGPGAGGRTAALGNAAEPQPRQQPLAAATAAQPMAPLLAALASDDTRWSRRGSGDASAAIDAPLRDWLAQVQAAATRWDAASERSARRDLQDRPASPALATLRLYRDGRPGAIVQIEEGGVRFDPLTGSAWFAPLPPEIVARLRATLPPAPR